MKQDVNSSGKRKYDTSRRQAAARETRARIVTVARAMLLERGYSGTRMADIAEAAGVSVETLYAGLGPKAQLVRHLLETALSGQDEPVPALERDWVLEIYAEGDPRRMIEMLASGARQLEERIAPVWSVVNEAANTDAALRAIITELNDRRATHMRAFIDDLSAKGGLNQDVSEESATDVLWAMNSPEMFILFTTERSWTPDRFEQWLANTWKRLLSSP